MLDVMSLLSEAQTLEQGCGCMIFGVRDSRNSMFAQCAKNKMQQTIESLGGVAATLMARGECDANLHLARVILPAVQPAIANQGFARPLDNGDLKPSSRNSRLTVALTLDEVCCVVWPERLPRLIPSHLGQ